MSKRDCESSKLERVLLLSTIDKTTVKNLSKEFWQEFDMERILFRNRIA